MAQNTSLLLPVKITNKNYGSLTGTEILITEELKKGLEGIKKKDGTTLFSNLETRGFQGGKHLIELLKSKYGAQRKLILSHGDSSISEDNITINYKNFNEGSRSKFFSIYRQTGLEAAIEFLEKEFPGDFPPSDSSATNKETKKVIGSLPQSVKRLPATQKKQLIKGITEVFPELNIRDSAILTEMRAAANQSFYKNKLGILTDRLSKNYPETKGSNSWQKWIYKNTWVFGVNYLQAIEKTKVGFDQIPDYLFLTTDGFLDILEIKTPQKPVIKEDTDHTGSYYWDLELSKTIGQVVNYLYQVELHQLEIPKNLKKHGVEVLTIKPRAIILIGRSDEWGEEEKEAFRKLNFSLHGIEILTYDQLLNRGYELTGIYDKKQD